MSIFISDHKIVIKNYAPCVCAKTAQKSANSEWPEQKPCQPASHAPRMGKIITVEFRRSILPRCLLDDGWWLESKPARSVVIAFPQCRPPDPKPHLTLIKPEK